jgi:proline iminopeptidase
MAACLPPQLTRFERFENCGHGVHRDDPQRAFALLREFILG